MRSANWSEGRVDSAAKPGGRHCSVEKNCEIGVGLQKPLKFRMKTANSIVSRIFFRSGV